MKRLAALAALCWCLGHRWHSPTFGRMRQCAHCRAWQVWCPKLGRWESCEVPWWRELWHTAPIYLRLAWWRIKVWREARLNARLRARVMRCR